MKKNILLMLLVLGILTGCTSKSSFSFPIDDFSFRLYDNAKVYTSAMIQNNPTKEIGVLVAMKEQIGENDTGYINSLIVAKVPIKTGVVIKDLVNANIKKTQLQLFKFTSLSTSKKNIVCDDTEYSGYTTTFSYQLASEMLYGAQYFFIDATSLYIVSLSSDDKKDIQLFVNSTKKIVCDK